MPDETGFLGDSHRAFLEGEEKTNPSVYKARVRDRTEAALFDFYYLFEYLEQEQIQKMFGPRFAPPVENDHQKVADPNIDEVSRETIENVRASPATAAYAEFAIAFLLRGLSYGENIYPGLEQATGEQQPAFDHFTECVEHSVRRYLTEKKQLHADVNVRIELENIAPSDELIEQRSTETDEE